MNMQDDTKLNDTFGKLAAALAKAQAAFPKIGLDREVTVKTLTGGTYKFKYATLGNIIDTTRKALSENELAVSQMLHGTHVVTHLLHSSGEFLNSDVEIPTTKRDRDGHEVPLTIQERGSAYSYYRRYAYVAIIGVVGEEDDDANVADGNSFKDSDPRGPVAPTPAAPPAAAKKAEPPKAAAKQAGKAATPPAKAPEAPAPAPDTPPPADAPQGIKDLPQTKARLDTGHHFGEPQKGEPVITMALKSRILAAFKPFGITQEDLEKKAGYPMDKWTGSESDKKLGMRAQLNLDFQVLRLGYCTPKEWLATELPAMHFTGPKAS
jgi:hypothetical protein